MYFFIEGISIFVHLTTKLNVIKIKIEVKVIYKCTINNNGLTSEIECLFETKSKFTRSLQNLTNIRSFKNMWVILGI